jgi:tRNA A37 threonylcarbamoyltransferase TsaD
MKILAFESSCDETAVAVVEDGRTVLSDAIASQADLHALYGGAGDRLPQACGGHCRPDGPGSAAGGL